MAKRRRARRGLEQLTAWAEDRRLRRRLYAATALRQAREDEAEEVLFGLLQDQSLLVRQVAIGSLVERDETRPVEPILAALRRRDRSELVGPPDARELIEPLAKLNDPRAVEQLVGELQSPDEPVRRAAAEALGALCARDAVRPLRRVLRDPSAWVRHAALDALFAIDTDEARLAIADVRKRGRLRDRVYVLRRGLGRGTRAPAA